MQVKVNNLGYKYKSKNNSSVVKNTVSKKIFILSVFGGSTSQPFSEKGKISNNIIKGSVFSKQNHYYIL